MGSILEAQSIICSVAEANLILTKVLYWQKMQTTENLCQVPRVTRWKLRLGFRICPEHEWKHHAFNQQRSPWDIQIKQIRVEETWSSKNPFRWRIEKHELSSKLLSPFIIRSSRPRTSAILIRPSGNSGIITEQILTEWTEYFGKYTMYLLCNGY